MPPHTPLAGKEARARAERATDEKHGVGSASFPITEAADKGGGASRGGGGGAVIYYSRHTIAIKEGEPRVKNSSRVCRAAMAALPSPSLAPSLPPSVPPSLPHSLPHAKASESEAPHPHPISPPTAIPSEDSGTVGV